jgi:hypothetical protein
MKANLSFYFLGFFLLLSATVEGRSVSSQVEKSPAACQIHTGETFSLTTDAGNFPLLSETVFSVISLHTERKDEGNSYFSGSFKQAKELAERSGLRQYRHYFTNLCISFSKIDFIFPFHYFW